MLAFDAPAFEALQLLSGEVAPPHKREDLQEALDIFEKVGVELGVIGPHKEAMADHWAKMAETVAI